MKVILNVITSFGNKDLKPGDVIDVSLKVGQRWINRGIAHKAVAVNTSGIPEPNKEIKADLVFDEIEEVTMKPKVKVIPKKLVDIPDEVFEIPKKRKKSKRKNVKYNKS